MPKSRRRNRKRRSSRRLVTAWRSAFKRRSSARKGRKSGRYTIDAKPTEYNGRQHRSRLEARWSVYFESAGIEFEYEPTAYELPDGKGYLPDFETSDAIIEIKPDEPSRQEKRKARQVADITGKTVLIYAGMPHNAQVYTFKPGKRVTVGPFEGNKVAAIAARVQRFDGKQAA